ncbi:tetratricopeptide repeat protein [Endozoicomonas gorgoniicola]|uniref:Tetratricopeptide repeat protein n=1 Tax=Endozoicomonas gorgoniicola TaxID=1234144 RepID=A0ABT3MVQ8_9GAMM|nr:tetratricopeptide repeat protein [Endozoicomonas gorgoniicola]MCW7553440.1 tetratricopeptide repeat protein [Endozoicomonas gorgoniicola]
MTEFFSQFHFLRPMWLLMLLPSLLLLTQVWRQQQTSGNWSKVIAPRLLAHLIHGETHQPQRWPLALLTTGWILACIALAGPTWQKVTTPVSKSQHPLVVVADLSYHQYATDLPPDRMTRLRYKLLDLFRLRQDGLTAIVVFAGGAHTVSPLTDDTHTLSNMVPALSPGIMPEQGQNPLSGIEQAIKLLSQGASEQGDILLITDSIPSYQISDIETLIKQSGHKLSILGIGSEQGAPIAIPGGGYLKDNQGAILVPRLNRTELQQLTRAVSGQYRDLSLDNSDLDALLPKPDASDSVVKVDRQFDQWHDAGYWLVLLLLPLALISFRKGWLLVLFVLFTALPEQQAMAFEWSVLWKNTDQRGAAALDNNDPESAIQLFKDPDWKAEALYRNQQFEDAASFFSESETAQGFYNQGNALAKAGKLDDAIAAYNKAIELQPDMDDAKFNKALLEKLKQQQEQQKQQNQDDKNQQEQQNQQNQNDKNQQDQQNSEGEQQQSQDSSQQDQENRDSQNQQADDQQQSEQQQSEQQESQQQEQQKQDAQQQNAQTEEQKQEQQEQHSASQQQADREQDEQQQQAMMEQPAEELDAQTPDQQAVENWLNTIPDDPGGLLRRKFLHQQQLRQENRQQERAW